ncbi:hypothetical protein PENSPDRAFT_688195 [Peniophora sp. CONT]|nr:hypothetical protein PENSPDRAFT_688195 [Peniophora sp. CONT]
MTSRTTLSASRLASLLLAAVLLPGVRADCFIDARGFERCDGLSVGARVGIAIGIFAAVLALSLYFGYVRRRRIQQANLAYINQNQQYGNQQNFHPQGQFQQGGYAPQYPPQTPYGQQSPYPQHGYDAGQTYAPPPGPPPQAHVAGSPAPPPDYYGPPSGPPPNSGMNKPPMSV